MTALPEDIGPALRAAVNAVWSDDAVKARYPSAKDGVAAPREGFFDHKADAQAMAEAAAVLKGAFRRRFAVTADGEQWLDPSAGLPVVKLIDPEQAIGGFAIITRIEIDLNSERTNLELYG